jgi:hypothetical protein
VQYILPRPNAAPGGIASDGTRVFLTETGTGMITSITPTDVAIPSARKDSPAGW